MVHMNLDFPNSCTYEPKTKLQEITRFSDTGLGKGLKYFFKFLFSGKKYDFTKCPNRNPGPGTYFIPSRFDKFDQKKQKLYKQ